MAAGDRAVVDIVETLQSSHINTHPDVAYDLNPSTAASKKAPVRFRARSAESLPSIESDDEIPIDILEPQPRRTNMPPLPDFRFEQSYLARIKPYVDTGNYKMVVWQTVYDNVIMSFVQAMGLKVVLLGWRQFNLGANFSGQSVGARVRRWWWGVNNWTLPSSAESGRDDVGEFVVNQFGSAGSD